ncbi:ferredoxin-NADP reductase [Sinorhizobium fredii]
MTMMLTGTMPTPLPLDQMKPWNSARQMLVCTSVTDEAPDVKTFTFAVEGGGWFNYMPGQFITVELRAKGGDLHRTYTVSSSPSRPYAIAITIKAQPTSIGTRWMFENVRPGSRVRAYGPSGHFTLSRNPGKEYLFISAGSGITPMMSMLRWLSDCAPDTDVVFINSARRPEEIIFREELELLAKRMPNLSLGFLPEARSVASPWAGLMGRIDRHKLSMLTPEAGPGDRAGGKADRRDGQLPRFERGAGLRTRQDHSGDRASCGCAHSRRLRIRHLWHLQGAEAIGGGRDAPQWRHQRSGNQCRLRAGLLLATNDPCRDRGVTWNGKPACKTSERRKTCSSPGSSACPTAPMWAMRR